MKFNYKPQGKSIMITLLFIMFFISNVSAQKESTPISSTTTTKVKNADWQLLLSNEFVDVSYRYAECNLPSRGTHNENFYLQIKNKTNQTINCEWNTEFWYNNNCNGCETENRENHKKLALKANEAISGECSATSNPALIIFSKMLNYEIKSNLTNFNIRDLKTQPVSN